jgi:hypothetical protein
VTFGLADALSSRCLQHLDSLCSSKRGKSNPFISNVKYSVVVGHEDGTQGPGIGYLIYHDTTIAIGGTLIPETLVEVSCYGEGNASEVEDNVRENGVARVNVESTLNSSRTRDLAVEFTNIIKIATDEPGSL